MTGSKHGKGREKTDGNIDSEADLGSSGSFSHDLLHTANSKDQEPGEQVPVWGEEMLLSPTGWAGGPTTLGTPCEGLSDLSVQPGSQQAELGETAHMATGDPGTRE